MFESLFTHLENFQKISVQDRETIVNNIRHKKIKEGEILLQEGKSAKEIFFICKGVLKIVGFNDKGNESINYFISENQFCTILKSFTDGVPSTDRIQAACDSEIIILEKDNLHSLHNALPYFKYLSGQVTKQALRNKIALQNLYIGQDATSRYQQFILQQSNIAFRLSQTDIASYLGIKKQSLSRIKKNLL